MKKIGYWAATIIIAFLLLSGGVTDLLRPPQAVAGMAVLGYPAYMMLILGVWKVLGGVAILAPRFPRLKEWAYAGIVFDFTGASASHAASGDYGTGYFHIYVPLILTLIALASWKLRPPTRKL